MRLSENRTRVTSLLGKGTKPYSGAPAHKASQFLRENHLLFGLEPDLKNIKILEQRDSPFGANVEFQQIFYGLPVENGR